MNDLWGDKLVENDYASFVSSTNYEDIVYDMAFSFDESITPLEKIALFTKFGNSKAILSLSCGTIKTLLGRGWTGSKFNPKKFIEDAVKMQDFIINANIKSVRFDSPHYPLGLKEIPDCPFLLYYKGNLNYNYYNALGFVGTRHPDENGIKVAMDYGNFFVDKGLTIVSGLALGVDSIGHSCACDKHAKTIAVMGGGIDRVYPATNKDLARKILDNDGAIVSEYPPSVSASKWRFPRRNRIIVGLSRGIFVAQAPIRSGSLITAFLTTDYNRDLFVANPISNVEQFSGNTMLIEKGATLLQKPEDIISHWTY